MNHTLAVTLGIGDVVVYRGRRCSINAVALRGVCAPHFTLSYLDVDQPSEGWTSYALCQVAEPEVAVQ